jgi:hypothetical protein
VSIICTIRNGGAAARASPPRPAGVADPYRPFNLDYYAYPPPFLLGHGAARPAGRRLHGAARPVVRAQRAAAGRWSVDPGPVDRGAERSPGAPAGPASSSPASPCSPRCRSATSRSRWWCSPSSRWWPFTSDARRRAGRCSRSRSCPRSPPACWASSCWPSVAGAAPPGLRASGRSCSPSRSLTLGVDPTMSFFTYTIPRLGSGEVFAFLDDDPFSVITNMSPFGLPFKLQLMGLDVGDPWVLGRRSAADTPSCWSSLAALAAAQIGDRRSPGRDVDVTAGPGRPAEPLRPRVHADRRCCGRSSS